MKRVYYSQQDEAFLGYNGLPLTYAHAAQTALLPVDAWALLQHMSCFAAFVEELLVVRVVPDEPEQQEETGDDAFAWLRNGVIDEEEEEEPPTAEPEDEAMLVSVEEMLGVAWRWHTDLVARALPLTGHYATAYFLSWTAFCQLFYMGSQASESRRHQLKHWRAQDYDFYRRMAARHTIDITAMPLSLYSLNDLWCSVRLIVTCGFYSEPYAPGMKQYLYALFYRYCELISVELGDISLVLDNPLFIATGGGATFDDYNAYKSLAIPVNEQLSLSSEYVYEGQALFYGQLYRISLSDRLQSMWEDAPLVLETPLDRETETLCQEAWLAMLSTVFQDKLLGQFIVTDFKCNLLRLHLYHGEQEQYKRRWPESNAEPGDVMLMLRPDDHVRAIAVHTLPLMDVLKQYREERRHETEMVYLTCQVTARWLASRNVAGHKERLMPHFQLDQLCTLEQLDAATLRDDAQVPLLLSLMRLYYVVWGARVYRTPHFVHAYLVWLQLLVARLGLVPPDCIQPALQECIGLFSVI